MIAIDTNILVRYLTQDDPQQFEIASELIESALSKGNPIFVSLVVILESIWVLQETYSFDKQKIVNFLHFISSEPGFVLQEKEAILKALKIFTHHHNDFPDLLIGSISEMKNCEVIYTFDKKLKKYPPFKVLKISSKS